MANLPPDVADALRRGEPLEAMKLLRASANLSLKDAKQAIDRVTGKPASAKPSLQEFFRTQAAKSAQADKGGATRPAAAMQPAHRAEPLRAPQEGDLSPGEVPRRGGIAFRWIAVAAVLVYAWFRLRGG